MVERAEIWLVLSAVSARMVGLVTDANLMWTSVSKARAITEEPARTLWGHSRVFVQPAGQDPVVL